MVKRPDSPPGKPGHEEGAWGVYAVIAGIVGLVLLSGQCSSDDDGSAANSAAFTNATFESEPEPSPEAPPAVEALSAASVNRGLTHVRLAYAAEGFSGAMVYSQNCYDALGRSFSWAKLDTCGGADLLAVRALMDGDATALSNEADYFEGEAAAGRYLAAAVSAGEATAEADQRLSNLQAKIGAVRPLAAPKPAPEVADATADIEDSSTANSASPTDAPSDADWLNRATDPPAETPDDEE